MRIRLTSTLPLPKVARVIVALISTWLGTVSCDMNKAEPSFILFLAAFLASSFGKQETRELNLISQLLYSKGLKEALYGY